MNLLSEIGLLDMQYEPGQAGKAPCMQGRGKSLDKNRCPIVPRVGRMIAIDPTVNTTAA